MQRAHLRALIRSGELIPLLVKRNNRMWVSLTEEESWKAGDRIIYLLHDPKPKLLQRLSGGSRPTDQTNCRKAPRSGGRAPADESGRCSSS